MVGYYRTSWANAIGRGDIYADGVAGRGYGQGWNASCGAYCSFSGSYYGGDADWYMKIGYRE